MYKEGAGVFIHLLELQDFSNEAPVSTTVAFLLACPCCVSQELHCCLWNRQTCISDSSWTCWMKDHLPDLTTCGTFIFLAVPVHMVPDIMGHCGGLLSGIQLSHSTQHFTMKSYEMCRWPWWGILHNAGRLKNFHPLIPLHCRTMEGKFSMQLKVVGIKGAGRGGVWSCGMDLLNVAEGGCVWHAGQSAQSTLLTESVKRVNWLTAGAWQRVFDMKSAR